MAVDYNKEMPPIPTRTHHLHQHDFRRESRRRSLPSHTPKRVSVPPADPEIISELITSLGVGGSHFDPVSAAATSLSVPSSPGPGSFGVDYGAFSHQGTLGDLREEPDLDELAATAPTIRTSKPPSGYSALTAPKSPRSPRSPSFGPDGGLRSLIKSSTSRPSSRGSNQNDETQSIGNLSIERGAITPDLNHSRSQDSWGKKINRNSKGLMYMSSKERLRERDYERKRASGGAIGPNGAAGGFVVQSGNQDDAFFAETAIKEEPTAHGDVERALDSPRAIPTRDSSLRKTPNAKRSSVRKSKRNSDGIYDTFHEDTDGERSSRKHGRSGSDIGASGKSFLWSAEQGSPGKSKTMSSRSMLDSSRSADFRMDGDSDDESAPFPAVSQGRRRSQQEQRSSRRLSGRQSPGPNDGIKLKRSSSRLKRLSGQMNPKSDERLREGSMDLQGPPLERPGSADSVDDAVEAYLSSPRLSQKIRHPQTGRVISFSEVGDAEGSAVFCCVGMGLTRYITSFYDELALTLKLRLITPDRPGVGDSEPHTDGTATPLSWPDDVYAICQALKITKFSILAHSAGAIYALATALRMPQHIRGRIHLLAPWIPPSQMNVFGASQAMPPANAIPTSQRILRALPTPILKAANSSFMTATSSSITSSLPKNTKRNKKKQTPKETTQPTRHVTPSLDKENIGQVYDKGRMQNGDGLHVHSDSMTGRDGRQPQRPTDTRKDGEASIFEAAADAAADKERQNIYDTRLMTAIWEQATTNANPAVDLLVCLERRHTIGFRYVDIARPVVIHHGSRDTRVPVDNVRWLGKTMRRCEVRVLEGEGHGLMASAGVMGAVLMEISKEWEDWNRVTSTEGRRERERKRAGMIRV